MTALVEEMAQISDKRAARDTQKIGEAMLFYSRVREQAVEQSADYSHAGGKEKLR
jgi:hypothetical protein